jgi:3-isopropylmalate dehydrogenase
LEAAVRSVLDKGLRTADIMQDGKELVSTTDMGQAVVEEMAALGK